MAFLRYLDEVGQIQTKVLDAAQFIIGRVATAQLTIDDDLVSREHARIDLEGDTRYRLKDLGSRNRTFVNGELISETLLASGDIIRIGDRVLEFLEDGGGAEKVDLEFLTPDRNEPPNCEWLKIRSPLTLTISQLEQLSQLTGDQPLTARAEDVAHAVLGRLMLDLQAERGFLALRGEGKTDLRPIAHRALKRSSGGSLIPVSQSFVTTPLLQSVAGRYPLTASQMDAKLGYAATALVAPLTFRAEPIGVVYLDRPSSKKPFPALSLTVLAAAGAQIGALLAESTRRLSRNAVREGAAWMGVIRRLQQSLSGHVTSSDSFDVAMICHPGRARCGDFADVAHVDETRCGVILVDGGGRGVVGMAQANALRVAAQVALKVSDETVSDPGPMFNMLNRSIVSSKARQVVPFTFIGVDMSAGKLTYINAGGTPPLLMVAPGRLVTLDQQALILGADPDHFYEYARVDLPEVFRLVCHTDGLTEVPNAAGQPLGDQRLHETLLEPSAFERVEEILARLTQMWTSHLSGSQPDDDALILILGRG